MQNRRFRNYPRDACQVTGMRRVICVPENRPLGFASISIADSAADGLHYDVLSRCWRITGDHV